MCMGQVLGFVVILVGTSLYNEIIRSCLPTAMTSAGSRPDLEVSARGVAPVASWQLCHQVVRRNRLDSSVHGGP